MIEIKTFVIIILLKISTTTKEPWGRMHKYFGRVTGGKWDVTLVMLALLCRRECNLTSVFTTFAECFNDIFDPCATRDMM